MFDYDLSLICGVDIPIPECQITVHQPTIKEIALIGETNFFKGAQSLCVNKKLVLSKDKTGLEDTSNFQIFMTMMSKQETRDKKEAVDQLLSIIFPDYKIILTPQSMIFKDSKNGESAIVDKNNFEILQKVLLDIFCLKSSGGGSDFNPKGNKAKEIAEKLMQGRQRVSNEKKDDNGGSPLITYSSVLAVGLKSMSLQDCVNLTIYQLYDLVHRYTLYINWDIDLKSRLAGAKPEKSPDNWMKNIH